MLILCWKYNVFIFHSFDLCPSLPCLKTLWSCLNDHHCFLTTINPKPKMIHVNNQSITINYYNFPHGFKIAPIRGQVTSNVSLSQKRNIGRYIHSLVDGCTLLYKVLRFIETFRKGEKICTKARSPCLLLTSCYVY